MAHGTTRAAQLHTGVPSPPQEAWGNGDRPGHLRVDVDGARFRVRTPKVSTQWLPDTPSHRHVAVVWFRWLVDEHGNPLFALQA